MPNNLFIQLIARLNKSLSKAQIQTDLKDIEKTPFYVRLIGRLNKSLTRRNIENDVQNAARNISVDVNARVSERELQQSFDVARQNLENRIQNDPINVPVSVDTEDIEQGQQQIHNLNNEARNSRSIFSEYLNAREIFRAVTNAIKEAVNEVKELNKAQTDLQIVTGKSNAEMVSLMNKYNELAKDMSVTTKNVASSADEWLRQGKSVAETDELIKDSVILAKVGQIDAADATKYLTSAMNGFKTETSDVIGIVDKLTGVDLESATSAGGLAEAMSKCANSADVAGVSMDSLIGYIATVAEVTQKSDSVVGESFKSILARMGKIKLNNWIDEDGKDISGEINDVEKTLAQFDIKLRNSATEFRNFEDVIYDVGMAWDKFSSVDQNAIANAFGGVYQRENVIALFENFNRALELSEISANSAGTAYQKFEIYENSLEAATNRLTAAFEELAYNTIDSKFLTGLTNATAGIVEFVDNTKLIQTGLTATLFTGVISGLVALGARMIVVKNNVAQFTQAMNLSRSSTAIVGAQYDALRNSVRGLTEAQLRLVLSSRQLTETQRLDLMQSAGIEQSRQRQLLQTWNLTNATNAQTSATFSLRGAWEGLKASIATNPIGLIVTALTLATTAVTAYKQKQEEIRQEALDSANALDDQITALENLKKKYEDICNSTDSEKTKNEQLNGIKQELIETHGIEKEHLEDLNLEREKGLDLLDSEFNKLNRNARNKYLEENKKSIAKANMVMGESFSGNNVYTLTNYEGKIADSVLNLFDNNQDDNGTLRLSYHSDDVVDSLEKANSIYSELLELKSKRELSKDETALLDKIKGDVDYYQKLYDKYYEIYSTSATYKAQNLVENYLATDNGNIENVGKDTFKAWANGLLEQATNPEEKRKLQEHIEEIFPDYAEYFKNLDLAKSMFGVSGNINNGFDAGKKKFLEELSDEDLKIAVDIPDLFADGLDGASKKIQEFKADPNNNPVPEEEAEISLDDFVKKLTDKTKLIKSAMEELRDSGNISASTYAEIVEMGGNFADCLEVQNGKLILNIEKLKELEEQELRNKIAETRLSKASWETVMATHAMAGEDTSAIAEKIRELTNQEAVFNQAIDEITNAKPDDKKDKDLWKEEFDNLNAAWLHDVAMKKKTQDEYINWLDGAYKHYFSDLSKYATEYYKYEEEVFNHNRDLVKKSHEDVLDSIDKQIDELEKKIDREDFGENNPLDNIHNITGAYEQEIDLFKKAVSEIDKQIDEIKKSGLVDVGDELDELFKKREDYLDKIYNAEKSSDKVKEEFYKTAIDNETSYWEDLKSKQEDIYDKEIDKLEKVKDAISKKNEEEEKATDLAEKQLALEKAKLELEKARQNRSVMLVTKQGTFYTADQSAIDEAEKNVKDAEKDIADAKKDDVTDKISEQIDVLKEQKENTQNYYDTIIKLLEDSQNDPLQAEANRDLWGKILATENGQNAIASADQDKVNKLIENGFLAFNDGKYSLNNPDAEVPKDSQTIDTTDIKNVLTTLFGKKEGYTPERIDSIAEKFELYKHRLYGGTAPSDVVNKATESINKTINNSQVINKVQNMNTTYHIDKVEVGYSGNDFEELMADTLDSISQQIIIDGNKALHGR